MLDSIMNDKRDYIDDIRYLVTSTPITQDGKDTVKVVSWNIQHGYSIESIIDALLKHEDLAGVDTILLQEVNENTSKHHDLPKLISDKIGMNAVYGTEFLNERDSSRTGNIVLSRYPINNAEVLRLQDGYKLPDGAVKRMIGGRMAIACDIKINGIMVRVYCTHLEISPNSRYRWKQAQPILKHLSSYRGHVVLGGDFNLIFGNYERLLTNLKEKGFHDPFEQLKGSTLNGLRKYLGMKLDRIFLKELQWRSRGIVEINGSDHRPVYTTFELPKQS